jgi:hypothetical protein
MAQTDTDSIYVKKEILLDATAVSEATAEALETGSGKLSSPDNATAYPVFDATEVVDITITPLGDFDIRLKKDSEAVNAGTGGYGFSVFLSSVTVEPASGLYYYNLSVHTT